MVGVTWLTWISFMITFVDTSSRVMWELISGSCLIFDAKGSLVALVIVMNALMVDTV